MPLFLSIMILSLGGQDSAAQDSRPGLEEVVRRYEKGILKIEGVKEIVPDQVKGKGVITVRVETADARDTVLLVTHEKLEGYPVRVILSKDPLPPRPGSKSPDSRDPAVRPACGHCRVHCPPRAEMNSDKGGGASKEPPPTPSPSDAKKAPEQVCARCPLHCKDVEDRARAAEPAAPTSPQAPSPPPEGADKPTGPEPQCDVARKLQGLPPLKSGRLGCEEIVSTSNNPDRIRWAIEKSLPHWVSKEMPGVKGTARDGIPCQAHGTHSTSEFVTYSWVRHGKFCPLKDVLSPKDLRPQGKKPSD